MSEPLSPPAKTRKEIWRATQTQNLYLHVPSGNYYARLSVRGRQSWRTLKTGVYQTAKERLPAKLEDMGARPKDASDRLQTFAQIVAALKKQVEADPGIMNSTREGYLFMLSALEKGAKLPTAPLREITFQEILEWWRAARERYAPQQANHLLMWVRRGIEMARKVGVVREDITEDLKRVRIPRTRRTMLTQEQFLMVVTNLRQSSHWQAANCADWLEFAAYSGLRPGEMKGLRWEHIDEKKGVIRVMTGKTVAQTGRQRPVPIIAALQNLLNRMEREGGYVFPRKEGPRSVVLGRICKRLGLPPQRLYDLRHLFATISIASGVDVPTVSNWLGHADGGALAMRTYIHPDDSHLMKQAKKVKW